MSAAVQTEVGQSAKGKGISPLKERRTTNRRNPRQEKLSYAEACGRNRQNAESEGEWTAIDRRRGIRSVADKTDEEAPRSKGGRKERRDIVARRRNEAILVKVDQDANWIDSYREIVEAKDLLRETTDVRKTRIGHILIEINNKVSADEVAEKLKTAMKKDIEILLLANRETLEIAENSTLGNPASGSGSSGE